MAEMLPSLDFLEWGPTVLVQRRNVDEALAEAYRMGGLALVLFCQDGRIRYLASRVPSKELVWSDPHGKVTKFAFVDTRKELVQDVKIEVFNYRQVED